MDVESRESDWKQVQEIRQALNFIIFNLSSDLLGFLVCSDRSKVANNKQTQQYLHRGHKVSKLTKFLINLFSHLFISVPESSLSSLLVFP